MSQEVQQPPQPPFWGSPGKSSLDASQGQESAGEDQGRSGEAQGSESRLPSSSKVGRWPQISNFKTDLGLIEDDLLTWWLGDRTRQDKAGQRTTRSETDGRWHFESSDHVIVRDTTHQRATFLGSNGSEEPKNKYTGFRKIPGKFNQMYYIVCASNLMLVLWHLVLVIRDYFC